MTCNIAERNVRFGSVGVILPQIAWAAALGHERTLKRGVFCYEYRRGEPNYAYEPISATASTIM